MSTNSDIEINSLAADPAPESSFLGRHWQKLVALLLWVMIIGTFVWYVRYNGLTLAEGVFSILTEISTSAYGPLLYILLYALRPLTFFSAGLLTISGGFLFGPVWGIVYTVIGANASAMVAYTIGRYFGDGVLEGDDSGGIIQRYATRMRENSFLTVLIMRFIFLPYDLVNYASGFLRIDWKAFLLATIIGSIPGTIAFVLLGAAATPQEIENLFLTGEVPSLDWRVLALSAVMFVISIGLSIYFKRREQDTTGEVTTDGASDSMIDGEPVGESATIETQS
jgi:uncharacterized membrane protein YdjX (TVP38/TMEM64 family)